MSGHFELQAKAVHPEERADRTIREIVEEMRRTTKGRCRARRFVKQGLTYEACEGVQHGDRINGIALCWVHRQVVEFGKATLEQVLEGTRR